MISTKKNIPAQCLIFFIYYILICLFLYAFSAVALKNRIIINVWPFLEYQRHFYYSGYRNIWQNQSECVKVDKELIYSPKDGRCEFKNAEFNTSLSFSKMGRINPDKNFSSKKGIAVIGDSHAMGWGVNDEETFSGILQNKLIKPVYNLSVSSYGTFREIKRLKLSGLIDKVDTIIIQYCDNDLGENKEMVLDPHIDKKIDDFQKNLANKNINKKSSLSLAKDYVKFSIRHPVKKALSYLHKNKKNKNFQSHSVPFKEVIKYYEQDLKNKRIIVFYSNAWGGRFYNFPSGQDQDYLNLFFYDLNLTKDLYYNVDDHLKPIGHKKIADELIKIIK